MALCLFSPPAQTRARNGVSGSLGASFQDMFFHKYEINRLDTKNPRKAGQTAQNCGFCAAKAKAH
jgi:hypothetical protein